MGRAAGKIIAISGQSDKAPAPSHSTSKVVLQAPKACDSPSRSSGQHTLSRSVALAIHRLFPQPTKKAPRPTSTAPRYPTYSTFYHIRAAITSPTPGSHSTIRPFDVHWVFCFHPTCILGLAIRRVCFLFCVCTTTAASAGRILPTDSPTSRSPSHQPLQYFVAQHRRQQTAFITSHASSRLLG